jgi:hypothetical protein
LEAAIAEGRRERVKEGIREGGADWSADDKKLIP